MYQIILKLVYHLIFKVTIRGNTNFVYCDGHLPCPH